MAGFPLTLRHADVKRVINHNASLLILTSGVRVGVCQVQDAMIVRSNERRRKTGRFDLQQSPDVVSISITAIDNMPLMDLNLAIVRAAGFKTQRDFYDDWLDRRGRIDLELNVRVCRFARISTDRLLHRRVHRGYTNDPALAVRDEPSALSAADLTELKNAAAQRYEREHREDIARRQAASIRARRRQAEQRGDFKEAVKLTEQLAALAEQMRAA